MYINTATSFWLFMLLEFEKVGIISPRPHFPLWHAQFLPINVCDAKILGTSDFLAILCLLCLMFDDYLSYLMRLGSVLGHHKNHRILSHFPSNLCQKYKCIFCLKEMKLCLHECMSSSSCYFYEVGSIAVLCHVGNI